MTEEPVELGDAGSVDGDIFTKGVEIMGAAQLELEAKGYPAPLVDAAISRAQGIARWKTQHVGPAIRHQALLDTLKAELEHAEAWLQHEQNWDLKGGEDDGKD